MSDEEFEHVAKKRRSRWGQAPEHPAPAMSMAPAVPRQTMGIDLNAAAKAAKEALEKAKKAAAVQRQIQEQMAQLKAAGLHAGFFEGPKPRKLILDEFGRELDEDGSVVPMKSSITQTLIVNQAAAKAESKSNVDESLSNVKKQQQQSMFFDNSLRSDRKRDHGRRRKFNFLEEDHFTKLEEKLREQKLQSSKPGRRDDKKDDHKKDHKKGDDKKDEAKLDELKRPDISQMMRRDPVPCVEWWDQLIMKPVNEMGDPFELLENRITHYVEHPVPLHGGKEAPPAPQEMYLTKRERKKLRRLRRQKRNKEMTDKIKMGILPPPPPKVKMSNLMRVLGDEQIAEPSTVEKRVKDIVEQRKSGHEQRNEQRKLTDQELRRKKEKKWATVSGHECHVQVYKISELNSKKLQFKIDTNATQFHMTGALVTSPVGCIVVVEGSLRSARKYKRLMTRRLDWKEGAAADSDEDSDDDSKATQAPLCTLIWEGVVHTRSFKQWKVLTAKTEQEARKLMSDRGAEHYWDMLTRYRDVAKDL